MSGVWGVALGICVMVVGPIAAAQAPVPSPPAVTAADIQFMQDMLGHHAQAVEMTALINSRTRREDMRALGERISISQSDEMALMRRWLERHGGPGPSGMTTGAMAGSPLSQKMPGHDMAVSDHASLMPGMLSPVQLSALRAARGAQFERLLLRGMIQHHEGALTMVRQLMATPAAAQDSGINRFVTDVDADQRAEIRRMRRMLTMM